MMIVSDAPSCVVPHDRHDDSKDVIFSTGITHDDAQLRSAYFYSTDHWLAHDIVPALTLLLLNYSKIQKTSRKSLEPSMVYKS